MPSRSRGRAFAASIDGVEPRLGRPSFCGAVGDARDIVQADPEASAIAFSCGREHYVFAVRQKLRSDAADVVAALKRNGFAVEILSGDRASAVTHAALALGIDRWHAGMTPADKIARIAALQAQGRKVLMVGDGLNDAPSLAAADASLSVATAAHLTQAAADAVFLGDRLAPVIAAVTISRRARHIMRENLALAVGYNAIAVPHRHGGPRQPAHRGAGNVGLLDPRHAQRVAGEARGTGARGSRACNTGARRTGAAFMEVLIYLVPIALGLGLLGLAAFLWALKSGQYDDLEGAAWRALMDDDPAGGGAPAAAAVNARPLRISSPGFARSSPNA